MQNLKLKIKSIFLLIACGAALACQQRNIKTSKDQAQTSIPAIVSFNEHVQPIFSEYCYHCHGPDAGTRMPTKEPLRLDIEKDAFITRDFGAPVIVKGFPKQSELVRLMHSKDSSEIMPPPESHKTMSAHDIATVERWIEQGANYENHWSYDAIVRPEHVKNSWSDKPIDGFIFEKLQQVGLQPANVDDITRFYRRLSLDLTGLPPDPANTSRFIQAYTINSEAAVEAEHTYTLYGASSKTRGSFANSTLMARRLLERGVRFVQIFHRGWDQHRNLPRDIADQCNDIDQGCYGLIQDLKMRGMLEDTLVVVGGEFGRTVYSQGALSDTNYGRDHHPRCFSMWMAGGGIKGGTVYGATDELSYNITENSVHIRDLHATILHSLGIDHSLLTHKFQGLDQKLTGVEPAKVISDLFA